MVITPIAPEIAVAAAELPDFHADPVDRLLVATAEHHQCPILTKDSKIRDYAKGRALQAIW